ncbi:hypothetical protein [Pseudonocardia parietis]|uniref:Uncharacterized protein n=1 Tax=Pseudonocardia parietis TaxID=570936 RepID=A0ABS4W779_9PSEU|nr:hypothetical protein [Pseudonocardia parietis]MBP2372050.1 hypothetical protein [Pseudonocardia parietis]
MTRTGCCSSRTRHDRQRQRRRVRRVHGAAPVYELYELGDTGLASQSWPPTTATGFRGPAMSYHLRSGGHGLDEADWDTYLSGNLFKR